MLFLNCCQSDYLKYNSFKNTISKKKYRKYWLLIKDILYKSHYLEFLMAL